jgi:hypothetical protein
MKRSFLEAGNASGTSKNFSEMPRTVATGPAEVPKIYSSIIGRGEASSMRNLLYHLEKRHLQRNYESYHRRLVNMYQSCTEYIDFVRPKGRYFC